MSQDAVPAALELMRIMTAPGVAGIPGDGAANAIKRLRRHALDPEQVWADGCEWLDRRADAVAKEPGALHRELAARVPLLRAAMTILECELDPDWAALFTSQTTETAEEQ